MVQNSLSTNPNKNLSNECFLSGNISRVNGKCSVGSDRGSKSIKHRVNLSELPRIVILTGYRIPNNIRSWKLTNTEYQILFGLNYSNTELFANWNGPKYFNFR